METLISYIGSKTKLYTFLDEIIFKNYNKNNTNINFLDLFSGTNTVSYYIYENTNWNIYTNDFSNYSFDLFYFIYFNQINNEEYKQILFHLKEIEKLSLIENNIFNEFSMKGNPKTIDNNMKKIFFEQQKYASRMFFSEKVGKKIDTIKNYLYHYFYKQNNLNIVYKILKIFMLNYADKNRNTTSVYGAYLKNTKKMEKEKEFYNLNLINLLKPINTKNKRLLNPNKENIINILDMLYNKNLDKENTIIYLDPPYNTRSYESNYHILDYISNMDFTIELIKMNSKTATKKFPFKNSFQSKKNTFSIFLEMIEKSLKISNNVYISYNTDGIIKQTDMENIYQKLLPLYKNLVFNTYKKKYKRFKSNNIENNKELYEIIWELKIEK